MDPVNLVVYNSMTIYGRRPVFTFTHKGFFMFGPISLAITD